MRAGPLRHRVTIQELAEVQNTFGEVPQVWQDAEVSWASVEPLAGRELFAAQQVRPELTHKIVMRYRQISTKNRILFGNRIFNIDSVVNKDERNVMLTIMAIEKVLET